MTAVRAFVCGDIQMSYVDEGEALIMCPLWRIQLRSIPPQQLLVRLRAIQTFAKHLFVVVNK